MSHAADVFRLPRENGYDVGYAWGCECGTAPDEVYPDAATAALAAGRHSLNPDTTESPT